MDLNNRINTIISYPIGYTNLDLSTWKRPVYLTSDYVRSLVYGTGLDGEDEGNDYLYATSKDFPDFTPAQLWASSVEMLPLEGYLLGFSSGVPMCNFASLLNTPEFINQFYSDLTTSSSDFSSTYFLLLNTYPINPPVPIMAPLSTDPILQTRKVVEANPGTLFKNVAGLYSLPQPYIDWLGGIWNFRNTGDFSASYLNISGNATNGHTGVSYNIDPNNLDNNFFSSSGTPPTIITNLNVFKKVEIPSASVENKPYAYSVRYYVSDSGVSGQPLTSYYYGVDALTGFGIYWDLFSQLYNIWYGTPLQLPLDIRRINLSSRLRTFPTYEYDLGADYQLRTFATYSQIAYANIVDPSTNSLFQIIGTDTDDFDHSVFAMYVSIWKYLYSCLTNGVSYGTAADNAVSYYQGLSATNPKNISLLGQMQELFTFYQTLSTTTQIDDYNSINQSNGLFPAANPYATADDILKCSLRFSVDLVGSDVLRFINSDETPSIDSDFIRRYKLHDGYGTAVFALYPSAGGIAGLQYIMKYLNDIYSKTKSGGDQELTAQLINLTINACRMLWFTGPFIGDMPFITSQPKALVSSPTDFDSLTSKLYANNLGSQLLFNKGEFTNPYDQPESAQLVNKYAAILKDSRTYIMDANFLPRSYNTEGGYFYGVKANVTPHFNPIIKYDDIIDYVGCGVLDLCESEFLKNTLNALDLLLSLLVIDQGDFYPVTVTDAATGKQTTYTVQQQLDLLLIYNILHSDAYKLGTAFNGVQNMLQVINASLTQAQWYKVSRVIQTHMDTRRLLNVGSVYDYVYTIDTNGNVVQNMMDTVVFRNLTGLNDAQYVRSCLFGNQVLPSYKDSPEMNDSITKYLGRNGIYTDTQLRGLVKDFFETINVQPTLQTLQIAKDFLMYFIYSPDERLATPDTRFNLLKARIQFLVESANTDIEHCLTAIQTELIAANKALNAQAISNVADTAHSISPLNILKFKTYYNIKAIYDNWMQLSVNTQSNSTTAGSNLFLAYNYNHISNNGDTSGVSSSLAEHFMFVDRSMRDIGEKLLVNITWLSGYLNQNLSSSFKYDDTGDNFSIYTFLSDLAKKHSSVLHALPSYIDLGTLSTTPGKNNFAGDLFGTFTTVDVLETTPKFIFQFIGNGSSVLDTAPNQKLRTLAKSYMLTGGQVQNSNKNNTANIGNGTSIPQDVAKANGVAFVVNFGAQEQQMFSNLILDQSEFQNTEEYFKVITNLANQSQTQSGDLFSIFTERSYTATIDTLGNLMIQPLMYFELVNIPLFYGTYWITNVKHTITPNDIKTTFKGVRQPMSVMPSKGDVLMQLAKFSLENVLGTSITSNISPSPSSSMYQAQGSTVPKDTKNSDRIVVNGQTGVEIKNIVKRALKNDPKLMGIFANDPNAADSILKVVAGVMGNIEMECHFNYTTTNNKENNGSTDYGMFQWNSNSFNPLSQIPTDLEGQLNFLLTKTPNYQHFLFGNPNSSTPGVQEVESSPDGWNNLDAGWAAWLCASLGEVCADCNTTYQYYKSTDGVGKNPPFNRSKYAVDYYNRFYTPGDALSDLPASSGGAPTTIKKSIYTPNVKVFVFGDSHIVGALGTDIGVQLKALNKTLVYQSYGVNSAGYVNNYSNTGNINHKNDLIAKIQAFKPDIIVSNLCTNDRSPYTKTQVLNAAKLFFSTDGGHNNTTAFIGYNIALIDAMPYDEPQRSIIQNASAMVLRAASELNYASIDIFNEARITAAEHAQIENPSTETYTSDQWDLTPSGYQRMATLIVSKLAAITFK
jgi:hypothetical protein